MINNTFTFCSPNKKKKMVCAQPPRLRMTLVTVSEFLRLGGSSACRNLHNHNLHNSKEGEYQKSVRRKKVSVTLGVVLIPPVVFYLQPLPPGDFGESVSQQRPALNSPLCHIITTQTASARKEQQNFSVQVVEQLCPLAMAGGSPGGGTSCAR